MEGKLNVSGNEYEWWAGRASEEADARYCVHCWQSDYGVTRYFDDELDRSKAEAIANELVPAVNQVQA